MDNDRFPITQAKGMGGGTRWPVGPDAGGGEGVSAQERQVRALETIADVMTAKIGNDSQVLSTFREAIVNAVEAVSIDTPAEGVADAVINEVLNAGLLVRRRA